MFLDELGIGVQAVESGICVAEVLHAHLPSSLLDTHRSIIIEPQKAYPICIYVGHLYARTIIYHFSSADLYCFGTLLHFGKKRMCVTCIIYASGTLVQVPVARYASD
jgi:uncharacterized membrane protein required for colicin V production